jgi:nitroreductase
MRVRRRTCRCASILLARMTDTGDRVSWLRGMRAVRRFSADPIPQQVLNDILEAGRWTGSSKNTQPWHMIVVRDRPVLQTLAGCGPFAGHLAGAQAAIALVMDDGRRQFDEGRLAQNLMLAAWAHGVGSCIASLYPQDNTQRAMGVLEVPSAKWLHTVLSLGYPADASALRLSANPGNLSSVPIGRLDLQDLVSWDRFGRASSTVEGDP